MNVLLLLSGAAKDKWINAHNDIMPNNENPTKACFHAVWTAFIINYGASDKTAKGLRDFLWKARNQPIWNSMILRRDSTSLTSTYLYSQDSMAIALMMPTCSTPFRNVFWIGTIHTLTQTPWLKTLMMEGLFFRNKSTRFRNSIGIWNFCVIELSFLLARHSKIPFEFIFMNIIIMCLLIITIWKPCGQHGDSFNHRFWSWLVISFPMALLRLLLPLLPLLLLESWWHIQVMVAWILVAHTS